MSTLPDNSKSMDTFIHGIKEKLKTLKEEEYKTHNVPIEIPPEANLLLNNRSNTDAPKAYLSLMAKQKDLQKRQKGYDHTKDTISESVLEPYSVQQQSQQSQQSSGSVGRSNTDINLLEDLDLSCYQRPWNKLEHDLKINRAMHFVKREIPLRKLSQDQIKQLRILLIGAINKRIITKKGEVDYDEVTGELKKIPRLEYDIKTGHYFLKNCSDPQVSFIPPEKGEHGYISHVSELSSTQLSQLHVVVTGTITNTEKLKKTVIKPIGQLAS